MSATPIFDELAAEYSAGLGPTFGRHHWIDPPTQPIPQPPPPEEVRSVPTR